MCVKAPSPATLFAPPRAAPTRSRAAGAGPYFFPGRIPLPRAIAPPHGGTVKWPGMNGLPVQALSWFEWAEYLSYVVTIFGFPMAILVFLYEQRKERRGEAEAIYQRLSDEYVNFQKLVLDNADLRLLRAPGRRMDLTEEQRERQLAIFSILVSLFERAYLLVYEERMDRQLQRLWQSWADYMREWCRRPDFRELLPELLEGEDEEFAAYIRHIAAEEAGRAAQAMPGEAAPGRAAAPDQSR